jgi:hypothetical protein
MAAEGIVLAIALATAAAPASTTPPPDVTPPSAAAPAMAALPIAASQPAPASLASAGTIVIIELPQAVSSKTQKAGDTFPIRLASAVTAGAVVLIPAGTMGVGEIVDAAPSGALGRPAKLVLAARYLEHDGVRTPLRAMKLGAVGKDKSDEVMAIAFVPYVGILGAFLHGGEIEIPAGTYASAKLAAAVPAPSTSAPAPAPAPDTTVAATAIAPPPTDKKPATTGVGP